jgi:class 3 adenylate cyclase
VNRTASLLVVDDNEANRDALSRRLRQHGYGATTAADGLEALTLLPQSNFDLVLLDVEMPELDGIEMLRQMKADRSLCDIPVVMVSGVDEVESIARCIELGADDFITKPFEPRLMKARVRSSLDRKRLHDWERSYLHALEHEEALSERLIANLLPDAISRRLKGGETSIAEHFDDVSVLFADIVGFTARAATTEPRALVALLNDVFSHFDQLARGRALEKIKTIGDAYMVVGGLPERRQDHLTSVAHLALEMLEAAQNHHGIDLRIGVHCGPAVAGVIGTAKPSYDVWGDTINVASRMESQGLPGRIQVSANVRRRLEGSFDFEPRGVIEVRGRGPMRSYFLAARSQR